MIHTAEDLKGDQWPVQPWYRERKYKIKDGEEIKQVTVRERHPKWGRLHIAERKLYGDLAKENLISENWVDGLLIEHLRAQTLIDFLNDKNDRGYPYYWVSGYVDK